MFRTGPRRRGGAQFLYERTPAGSVKVSFSSWTRGFFVNDRGLDYALVAVKRQALNGAPLDQFQYLP